MSLAQAILTGTTAALQIVQQYISNPVIAGVGIECTQYEETADDDVSQQMIVNVGGGKTYESDNIAPRPRSWSITGYIYSQYNIPGTQVVIPSPLELSSLSPVLQPSLQLAVNKLRSARLSRQLVDFKTKNNEEFLKVGIVSLRLAADPSVTNKVPISITVREVPILNLYLGGSTTSGIPSGIDNPASAPASLGTVIASNVLVAAGAAITLGSIRVAETKK